MWRALAAAVLCFLLAGAGARAQTVLLEYRVKAAFLYNFTKYVEWPPAASSGPLVICVAGRNPFGPVLADTIRDERIAGRPLTQRIILEPEPGCHVLFVPRGAATPAYLRASRGTPTLTVGETPDFLAQGGMINFYPEQTNVRFEINMPAVERGQLKISSRLLQLARMSPQPPPGEGR